MKQFVDGGSDTAAGNFPKRGISLADNPVLNVKICCVYAISCLETGDLYIGSTQDLYQRVWSYWAWSHKTKASLGTHTKRFQRALERVSLSRLIVTVLEMCDTDELERLEESYCLAAALTLNTRANGLSRGSHVVHDTPNAYKPWWRSAKPTRAAKPYGKGCGSGSVQRKQVSVFGNAFPDIYNVAEVLGVSVMSVSRWCTDSRYKDFKYID